MAALSRSGSLSRELSDANDNMNEYESDDGTPLDRTIDKIGMGSYQWVLVSLCGFGWLADNMWLQAVAIILPRVQRHYDISDGHIGYLSSSMFSGMMLGALVWGTCSDLLGRITAFNGTLILTALFGIMASFASSFPYLCFSMFLLGSAVGGSMPTDGTLLLEHMPRGKQYLVTALSVFFSFGAVVAALVAIAVVPTNSCLGSTQPCDVDVENKGWQYLLQILAGMTLVMFLARVLFFKLHESPRYLVHAGRPHDAVLSLREITRYNGAEMQLKLEDVRDFNDDLTRDEDARAALDAGLNYRAADTHLNDIEPQGHANFPRHIDANELGRSDSATHLIEPNPVLKECLQNGNTTWFGKTLRVTQSRMSMVLCSEWRRTTLLVWAIWWAMSLAYTMFNVYLPKLLESGGRSDHSIRAREASLERTMWDIVIFTLGGCPGALLGAWLQEWRLGKRLSLALSTAVTAAFCLLFVTLKVSWAVTLSTVGISLSATTMWAVLYGWTPAIFTTAIRGTACGTASALSRVGGIMAPIIGGWLLVINPAYPVFASIFVFALASICVLGLSEDTGSKTPTGYQALGH